MQQNQQDAQGQIQQMQQGQVLMQQQIEAAIQQSHQEVLNLSQALQGMHQQMQQQTAAQVLSKPSTYDPVKSPGYAAFNDWSDHVITCVDAQIPGTWELLEHIKDTQPAAQVSIDDLSLHFPNIDRATLEYLNSTLYAVLITFTVGEARNIVRQARRPNGYEAWKLLQRRFNPVTIGRQRAGLTTIANPPANVPLAQLAGEIVSWETKITEFEARPHAEKISEAIKMAAVVSMCPNRLREHLQLNAQRYTTYMELREEIFTYIEHTQSLTATSMDIGSLQSKGSRRGAVPRRIRRRKARYELHALDEEPQELRDSGSHLEFDDGVRDRSDLYQGHTRVPELPLPEHYEQYEPSEGDLDVVASHARDLEDEVQEATSKRLALRVPIGPTEEEKREHMISHIPYRSWCADCIRGKGLAGAHRKQRLGQDAKEQRRPLIALDFEKEQSLPICPWWKNRPDATKGESQSNGLIESYIGKIEVELPALDLEAAEATQEKEVKRKKSYEPRGIYILRDIELEEYGYTPGCDGCEAAKLGLSHKQHSSACKQRIREAMLQTEEGRDKVERMERRAERFMVKFKEQQNEAEARKRKLSMDEPPEAKVPKGADGALVEEVSGQEGIPDIEFIEEPPGTAVGLLEDEGMGEEHGVEEQAQGLNQRFADTWGNVQKLAEAKEHLAFCCELYRKQMSRKKYFLREHPFLATSWNEDPMHRLLEELDTVYKVRGDMCQFGMQAEDEHGTGAVKKPSGFTTNSECIAEQLNVLCKNVNNELKVWKRVGFNANKLQSLKKGGPAWKQVVRRVTMDLNTNEVLQDLQDFQQATRWQLHGQPHDIATTFYYKDDNSQWHRRVQLIGGKAKQAEIYPDGLLQRILKGLKRQMQKKSPLSSLVFGPVNEEPYFDQTVLDQEDWTTFIDEVSGKALETSKVRAARAEEIDYATRYNVWRLVPTQEAWDVTGAGPIGSRWIDINKGDAEHPNYRSRLVIQEVRHSGVEAIFAATPPLESIRVLLSLQRSGKQGYKVMFTDIRRAHWTAKIERTVYVRLPPEAAEEGYCGRLNKAMYGCRDAARQWEIEITDFFTSQGFTPGLGSPVLYFHSVRDIKISVHGDDVTSLGRKDDLLWLEAIVDKI
ncbi:unnamed protein product [Durusdinium trenchii]|uniref:Reverse transcriptase Ty1/copia-type domain-containing protein n=1 Tax=Durusdinium trenchii TaxID=1381693 RepID=A0ABP0RX62_9DINO